MPRYGLDGKRIGFVPPDKAAAAPLQNIDAELLLRTRQLKAALSRDKFMEFVKFTSPDPEDPSDPNKSKYQNARHHDAIARALEEVEKGNIPFLILTCPPRHGKSELTTRRFTAWYSGRHPTENVVVATYNDDFAMDFGAEVRAIMQSPQYKWIFPNFALTRGGAAKDRIQTRERGLLTFKGRGGSLTGKGAHCFVGETEVMTPDGAQQIRYLAPGDTVLSYDQQTGCPVWRSVEAVSSRRASRLFRLTTASGRVAEATGDHPFYVDGSWIEAAQLASGDRLLCAVRSGACPNDSGRAETSETRDAGVFLLHRVLGALCQRTALWSARLRSVRRGSAEARVGRYAGPRSRVLFSGMSSARARGGIRGAGLGRDAAVRALQCAIRAGQRKIEVLWSGVRFAGAQQRDGERGQSALAGGGLGLQGRTTCSATLSGTTASCAPTRWRALYALWLRRAVGGAPHRRERAEQSCQQPGDCLQALPQASAFFRGQGDTVATVEDTGRGAAVYDIQVEETHCFFANGVLAHNCLIVDDIIKDDVEAQSQTVRDQAWNWLTKVALTRRMGKKLVIIIMTRWHSDDPVGRLTDPENPHYSAKLAAGIKIINLPAIAEDDDPLGRKPGEALWPDGPDRFDLEFLEQQREIDPLGFSALYQQRPSNVDGDLFQRENISYYEELPEGLRFYAVSDHAVSTKQRRDSTVLLTFGVDKNNTIYLCDCWWKRAASDAVVEGMLELVRLRRPLIWWAENGHISKAIGPFLRKRMSETNTFFNISEVQPSGDKAQRAQSFSARFSLGYVKFPRSKPWVEKAINELLAFPNGTHDDFVDACSLIGIGLGSQFGGHRRESKSDVPRFGSLAWVKYASKLKEAADSAAERGGF